MASLLDYLGYAGNMLDLPGSSLRDILSGRNPFDQWATPFSGDNRASGRDVLNPIFGANKETGMSGWLDDPWEGVKDLAGFGLEVVADPLNLIPAGALSKVLKGRKAARGVNAAAVAEQVGKYGYVNPKVANRVESVVLAAEDNPLMLKPGHTRVWQDTSKLSRYEADPWTVANMRSKGTGDVGKEVDPRQFWDTTSPWDTLTSKVNPPDVNSVQFKDVPDELVWGKGHYSEANPVAQSQFYHGSEVLLPEDMVDGNPAALLSGPSNPMKLLGYAPEPDVVYHGGHRWTPEPGYPYGRFRLDKIGTGEGNTVKGPGAYFADLEKTSNRYREDVMDKYRGMLPEDAERLYQRKAREEYPPGSSFPPSEWFMSSTAKEIDGKRFLADRINVIDVSPLKTDSPIPRFDVKYEMVGAAEDGSEAVIEQGVKSVPLSPGDFSRYFYPEKARYAPDPSALYKIELPAGTKSKLLDYEAPVQLQPEKVHDAIDTALPGYKDFSRDYKKAKDTYASMPVSSEGQLMRKEAVRAQRLNMITDFSEIASLNPNEAARYLAGEQKGEGILRHVLMAPANLAKVQSAAPFIQAGVPGTSHLDGWSRSAGVGSRNHVIWDQSLLDQARVRSINGERVPINPTTLTQQVPQLRQAGADQLVSSMNPVTLQREPGMSLPVMAGAIHNALARYNPRGGVQ